MVGYLLQSSWLIPLVSVQRSRDTQPKNEGLAEELNIRK